MYSRNTQMCFEEVHLPNYYHLKKGPLKVIARQDNKYTLLDLASGKIKNYHIKRLSQFIFDPHVWDPVRIAVRDTGDLFKVARVSDMQGNPRGSKQQLFFKVHWV